MKGETIERRTARLRALRLAAERGRPKPPERPRPVHGLGTELRFGRHRGETVEHVLGIDPGWIRWAIDSIPDFAVDDAVEAELTILDDPRRLGLP